MRHRVVVGAPWPPTVLMPGPPGPTTGAAARWTIRRGEWTHGLTAFHHPCGGEQGSFPGADGWTGWHTVSTEWRAGQVRFFVDGRLVGHDTRRVPDRPLSWVLQNENTLRGPGAAPAAARSSTSGVAAYAYDWGETGPRHSLGALARSSGWSGPSRGTAPGAALRLASTPQHLPVGVITGWPGAYRAVAGPL